MIHEENFIQELKNKNEEALDYLLDTYGWVLKTVLKKHLFSLMDYYEECMNDCLLAVWEGIDHYDPARASFSNWLGGLARFKAIDYLRKYQRYSDYENIEDHNLSDKGDPLDHLLRKEQGQEIREILSSLSQKDRLIFQKLYLEDLPMDQVAQDLESSKSSIYSRISRARKFLRKKQKYKEVRRK